MTTARAMAATIAPEPDEGHALATPAVAMDPTSAWAWERRGYARLGCGEPPSRAIADFSAAIRLDSKNPEE